MSYNPSFTYEFKRIFGGNVKVTPLRSLVVYEAYLNYKRNIWVR
jgi:hypothetical protein